MKKIIAFCLALVMIVSVSVSAFAAPNNFLPSPSEKWEPSVVSFESLTGNCDGELIVTPYLYRDTLPDVLKALIEQAYKVVTSTDDLTTLDKEFAKVVADKNLKADQLAVSHLFDVRIEGCMDHEGHYDFDIVLAASMLDKFVGLLHMNHDGEWELIENAKVTNNNKHLEFTAESLSPFAIIVENEKADPNSPQTDDSSNLHIYAIVLAVCGLAILVVGIKRRKQTAQ